MPGDEGRPAGVLCILAETTGRVVAQQRRKEAALRAEQRLAEQERRRLIAMVEHSSDLIGIADPDGRAV